jgi:DNA-binding winged helix-turn-helix (wHTH) protein
MRSARLHSSGQPISQIRLDSYAGTIRVGEWRATRISGELSGHGERERLEPKVMDLLFLLASRAPEVVGKEEILQCLWPRMLVGEDTLARAVFKLRKALRDDAKSPRYIETVPKRGYRLLVSAELSERDTAPSSPPAVEDTPAVSPIGLDEHDHAFTTPAPPRATLNHGFQVSRCRRLRDSGGHFTDLAGHFRTQVRTLRLARHDRARRRLLLPILASRQ